MDGGLGLNFIFCQVYGQWLQYTMNVLRKIYAYRAYCRAWTILRINPWALLSAYNPTCLSHTPGTWNSASIAWGMFLLAIKFYPLFRSIGPQVSWIWWCELAMIRPTLWFISFVQLKARWVGKVHTVDDVSFCPGRVEDANSIPDICYVFFFILFLLFCFSSQRRIRFPWLKT